MGNILPLIIEPDPLLHIPSDYVEEINDFTRQISEDMLATMYHHNGIGLAGIQVGIKQKIIVIDIDHYATSPEEFLHDGKPLCLINAKIVTKSKILSSHKEGCLSLPNIFSDVSRPNSITIEYFNQHGEKMEMTQENNLLAVCIQHEIDHTEGIVFIDHISYLKKHMALDKLKGLKQNEKLKKTEKYTDL